MWGGASLDCEQCHLANNTLADSHPKHYGVADVAVLADRTSATNTSSGTAYEFSCGVCHNSQPHADGNVSGDQAAQVAFDGTIAIDGGGGYVAGALAGTDTGGFEYTSGTCATTYCHSQGQSTTSPFGGGPNTTATWTGTLTCAGCHDFDAGEAPADRMSSGKHTPHMNDGTIMTNIACSACHTDTTSDSTTITNEANHVNQSKDVTIDSTYDDDATPGNNWSGTQCDNVYCHSTGEASPTYKTILWSATISDCESCHNYDANATFKMNSGNHTEHMNQAAFLGTNYGCQECHNSTTSDGTSITTPGNHIDTTRTVSIVKGGTWTDPDCTTTYCHSTGQATPTYQNPPSWGSVTALGCDSCHGTEGGTAFGEPAYANGSQPTVVENDDNSHSLHVSAAADCTKCHTDTADAAGTAIKASSLLHTNQARNVNFAVGIDTNGGTNFDNYNGGTKTCSAVVCHGDGSSPMWGNNTSNDTCTKCHGTGTVTVDGTNRYVVAPPVDLAGTSSNSTDTGEVDTVVGTKIGAHQTHLQLLNGLKSTTAVETLDTRCQQCHGTIPTDISHANGSGSPAFQGLATNSDTMSPVPSYDGTSCNNTYCHNPAAATGGTLATGNAGTNTSPDWNDATYIADGTLKTQTNCDRCHLSPNGARVISGSQDHSGLDVDSDGCAGCHGHDGNTAGADPDLHIDGQLHASGGDACDGCHSSFVSEGKHTEHTDRAGFLAGKSLTNNDYGGQGTAGMWWYDVTYVNGQPKFACGYCHPEVNASHTTGSTAYPPSGVVLDLANNDTDAVGTVKELNATAQSFTQSSGSVTCSSVYCHSPGYTTSPAPANDYQYQATPDWYAVNPWNGVDRCDQCHGNSPNNDNVNQIGTSAHGMHVVALHFKDISTGASGQITETGTTGTGAAHGDTNVSTTINCHLCHNETVTVNYNDLNNNATDGGTTACSACHDGGTAPLMGTMVVDTANNSHVDGTPSIQFANVAMKVRAQMRDAIKVVDSGTADGGTNSTLIDSTKSGSWTTDQWVEYNLKILTGAAAGEVRQITSNTTTELTVNIAFSASTSGEDYEILNLPPDEIYENWTRMNLYKDSNNSYEQSKKVLFGNANFNAGTQTCRNVACHNQDAALDRSIQWTNTLPADSNLCYNCHRRLTQ
jgi:predicted CxxxxCH...CXXCH cytochrome family protein